MDLSLSRQAFQQDPSQENMYDIFMKVQVELYSKSYYYVIHAMTKKMFLPVS